MKTYQYLEKPYVSPINLDVLNTTFSNLETMHQKAVQTGSELKAAIAKLPLNEAEEGFRDNLYTQIQETIDQNTIHGNLAAGYDDLVKYQGELLTNKALVGRINAQAEYLKTKDYIDKFDIPEEYREMYRELNQYYYEDEYDENGNVIGGSTWQPNKLPTKMINLSDLVTKGINRAAVEKGSYKVTHWLDKKGEVTTNPSEAFDGVVYNEITTQYERLGHDKIITAIKAVINETSGAKESIKQDYDVAVYQYKNDGINNGILNVDGSIKSEEEYLMYRIEPSAQIASYNRTISETSWGAGLANYKKAQNEVLEAAIKAQKENAISGLLNDLSVGGRGNNIHISTSGETIKRDKNILYNNILTTLRQIGISDDDINGLSNNYYILNNYISNIPKTNDNIEKLKYADILLRQYRLYDAQYQSLIDNKSDNGLVGEFDVYNKLKAGEILILGNSELETYLVNEVSEYKERQKEFNKKYNIPENEIFGFNDSIVSAAYDITGHLKLGPGVPFDRGTYRNGIVSTTLNNNISTDRLINHIISRNMNITKDTAKKLMEYYNIQGDVESFITDLRSLFKSDELYDTYSKICRSNEVDVKDISYETINSINLLNGNSFEESVLTKEYNNGNIDTATYNALTKRYNEDVINKLKNTNFSAHLMYMSTNGQTLELVGQKDILKNGDIIRKALDTGNYTISPAHVANLNDPVTNTLGGYYITILPQITTTTQTKDNEKELVELVEDSNTYTYYIPGIGGQTASDILLSDRTTQLNNFYQIIGDTQSSFNIYNTSDENTSIGDVEIKGYNSSSFGLNIFNQNYNIDKTTAIDLTSGFELIQNIKDNIAIENITLNEYLNDHKQVANYLDELVDKISKVTNEEISVIENLIINELSL